MKMIEKLVRLHRREIEAEIFDYLIIYFPLRILQMLWWLNHDVNKLR